MLGAFEVVTISVKTTFAHGLGDSRKLDIIVEVVLKSTDGFRGHLFDLASALRPLTGCSRPMSQFLVFLKGLSKCENRTPSHLMNLLPRD